MSDVTEHYQQQAQSGFSTIPWLYAQQSRALDEFKRMGFPTRKNEEWKYTQLHAFEQHLFTNACAPVTTDLIRATNPPISCDKIDIVNGRVLGTDALSKTLPDGVLVLPLSQALLAHEEMIKQYLGQSLQQTHAFHALNTAFLTEGVFIYVPPHVCLNKPLLLAHWQDGLEQAVYLRHLVIADVGSSVTVIEEYQGAETAAYFTNTVTEACLRKNATLTHYKLQRESKQAYHIGHLAVTQFEHSECNSHLLSLGGKLVRSDSTFELKEPHAHCLMNGLYAPTDGQHMDCHTQVTHAVAHCSSAQDYKGILMGHSRAVFNGKVFVAREAQKTSAKQQNKNLLLSKNAEIDTKPQLDIYADDVVCTHGATVGQLDEDALFYLATRGIDKEMATQYLIKAFASENLTQIPDSLLSGWIGDLLDQQIGG
jgi:Fe-S cluster assembly protein SufD